jgi:apolipoprotein N-acyltransferase
VSGYSQWRLLPVIQIASITGVWGVSALVVFPSAVLAAALPLDLPCSGAELKAALGAFFRREKIASLAFVVLLAASLVFGFTAKVDYSDAQKAALILVQHNTDPWKASKALTPQLAFEDYRNDFRILRRLSDEALAANPDTDLVVWSETAFVPRIYWHQTIRDDHDSWVLVKELLDYLAVQKVPFIIGNDDARKEPAKNPNPLENYQVNYNAALLFEGDEIKSLYRKLHLVPFTEHFPYQKQFPRIYRALVESDTHFWEPGDEAVVFESRGLKFSTPICFEDTFGDVSRAFVRNGAELIVNLSNDAWSKSVPAQMQHLSMAVFRAVENRRSMARSTASGQTCAIDPNGKILAMAEPFTEAALRVELPVLRVSSLYTAWGDWLPLALMGAAGIMLILPLISVIIKAVNNMKGRSA